MGLENPVGEQVIRDALREVVDPELGLDIVSLGLIREIDVSSSPIHVKMVLTTPFCPFAPMMVDHARRVASAAAGSEVHVELTGEQWNPEMMEDPQLLGF